jgi:hypothetical protein
MRGKEIENTAMNDRPFDLRDQGSPQKKGPSQGRAFR